jgi:radical SAM-linked protein
MQAKLAERGAAPTPGVAPTSRSGAARSAAERDESRRPFGPPPGLEAGATAKTQGLGNAEEWLNAGTEALTPAIETAAPAMRARLTYAKHGRARFISHLELIEVIDRACRRARLPLAFSRGHRPAPKLRFSPGLPVGAASDCEVLDIDLTAVLPSEEIGRRFGEHLPDGLRVVACEPLSLRAPGPEHGLIGFRYRVDIGEVLHDGNDGWIDGRLAEFVERASFPVLKRAGHGERTIDARPLIAHIARVAPHIVELDVRMTATGSVKPTDLLGALFELDAVTARALPLHKTHAYYTADAVEAPHTPAPSA